MPIVRFAPNLLAAATTHISLPHSLTELFLLPYEHNSSSSLQLLRSHTNMASPTSKATSSASSSTPAHLNPALNALAFFKRNSQKEFCRIDGVDPFTSIHSIHLFVRWLSSLPVHRFLSSDRLLVAWTVQGLLPGLKAFLFWSLAWENVSEERMKLEYLLWHLEMWRSIFSLKIVAEFARQKGKSRGVHIAEWYANTISENREELLKAAIGFWDRFSGKSGMHLSQSSCLSTYG
jgi:hypothetical protein